jgi:nitrogenase molybdenum-iron protein alpha/beta subunit
MKRLLALIGLEINMVFPYETTTEALKTLPEAGLNIVTSTAGLKAAQYLDEFYDIPYIYGLPYGDKGTLQWLKQVAKLVQKEIPAHLNEIDPSFSYHHYSEMISGGEFYQRDWRAVLACPPAMAKGFIQMVKEDWHFPLEAVRLTSQPKLDEVEEIKSLGVNKVFVTPGELEWKKVLEEIQPFILLGSAEDTALAKEVPVQLRITAPAFDEFNIYDGNPLVGYVGYQSLTQNLFQEISRYAWTKK